MSDTISLRQFLVLVFVSLFALLVRVVPGNVDRIAGRGGWLSMAVVFLVVGAFILLVGWAFQRLPGGGLGTLFRVSFGDGLGRVCCGLSAAVLFLLLGLSLRFYAERFASTLYPDTELGLFFTVLLFMAVWLSGKRFGTLARAGQIFFLCLVAVMVVVLVLNLNSVRLYHVWPVWLHNIKEVGQAGLFVTGVFGIAFGTLFCLPQVKDRSGGIKLALSWLGGLCALVALMGFIITGVFSANLTTTLQIPFFTLAKEVRVEGAFERMESLVAAMWVFTDVVLMGLLLRSFSKAVGECIQIERPELCDAVVLLLLPMGYLVAGSSFQLQTFYERWLIWVEAGCFYLLPLLAVIVGRIRGRL